ncbi:MAG: alpha/beta fold hydrolase [Planctomycetota bacterium]|jgi:predicted peptidase
MMSNGKCQVIIFVVLTLLVTPFCGCRQAKPSSLDSITVDGVKSYYMYSNGESGSKEGLPVVIIIDHPLGGCTSPERFAVKFDEPVLLIWCKPLDDLSPDTHVDDNAVWQKKRQVFLKQFQGYKDHFGFDERRVYLTGFSSTGVYAWMLAYDRPDLYAGVVAMSVVSYPQQIQQNLESGESIVTVVVIGQNDPMFLRREEQERQRGRVIESRNPRSKFVLKQGEDHSSIEKYWLQYLDYVLQFSKPDVSPSGS